MKAQTLQSPTERHYGRYRLLSYELNMVNIHALLLATDHVDKILSLFLAVKGI